MKTTIDIPENTLKDAMRYAGANTKREAVVTAMEDYVRRKRMVELTRHAGSCDSLMGIEELKRLRQS